MCESLYFEMTIRKGQADPSFTSTAYMRTALLNCFAIQSCALPAANPLLELLAIVTNHHVKYTFPIFNLLQIISHSMPVSSRLQ